MGFLDNLFGNDTSNTPSGLDWTPMDELCQVDEAVRESHQRPVILFKHSTRCSISRFALKQFEKEYDFPVEKARLYFLDLLQHRDISNEIAGRFGVAHQSPQLIVLREGKTVYDASHENIEARRVASYLD